MSLAIRALQKTARDIEAAAEADAATDLSGTIKAQAKLLVLWKLLHCYTDTSMKIIRLHTLWQPDISNLFGSNCSLPVSSMSKQHGQLWQAFLRHVRQDCSMNFANQTATAARAESICPSAGLDAWL